MNLDEARRTLGEASAPGADLAKMAAAQAKRMWGTGWDRLSPDMRAGQVALIVLQTWGTRVPAPDASPDAKLLFDAYREIAKLLA
jgi:hypothetical protein